MTPGKVFDARFQRHMRAVVPAPNPFGQAALPHVSDRVLEHVGHNPPQQSPQAFAQAVPELCPH